MLRSPRSSAFAALLLSAGLATAAAPLAPLPGGLRPVASVEGIDEYRLPNGLQVLLVPDDAKPTTTVNLTYRVGSRQESYGETGMAHLLEHLEFKGSPQHPDPKAELSRRGMAFNGTTSFDRTNYFASFAANDANLKWYLGWEADAMTHSFIARKDLDAEMTVVRNELESGENSPARILSQRTFALMFDWHNYGHPTIGARSDVENVDIPNLQAFYRRYYQPDNATLIVAGKFDPQKTLGWIAAAFGPIPKPTRVLPKLYTAEPVQDGERSVVLRRVGGVPLVQAAYHVPAAAAPDFAAVDLLSMILGDTPSGRLYKGLIQKQLASGVYAYAYDLADPGVLIAGAQLAPGQDVDKARAELLGALESIAREPISAEELARAKTQWLNDWEQAFANPEKIGIALSGPIALGDWRLFFLMRDRVRAAQLADVQRAANQYLLPSNRTLATYLPSEQPARAPMLAAVDVAHEMQAFKPQPAAARVAAFDATPANIQAQTQTSAVGGVKVALLPKPSRGEAVSAVLTLQFGDESSLAGHNTTAQAVAALLDKGTVDADGKAALDRQQIRDRLDALKTELSIAAAPGRVTVALQSRRDTLPAALALIGQMLRHPAFPEDAFVQWQRGVESAIEQQRKDPAALARNTLDRLANPYPPGDVRHRASFDEQAADVRGLTLPQLRDFQARFYGAARGEFAAVGAMDPAQVRDALAAALAGWQPGAPYTRIAQPLVAVQPTQLTLPVADKPNAVLLARLALPIDDSDPDYPALLVGNELIGSGSSSRLWQRIREKEGLSYGVGSAIDWATRDRNSTWRASAIFAPQNRAKVEAGFREEIARALKDGFDAKEVEAAKVSLLNARQLGRAQDAGLAFALANNLELGRTFARSAEVDAAIRQLTPEQVGAALRKYLTPDRFLTVVAGSFGG